mmetsp:Transcript_17663/g.29846  ORF Transcript_17663/g.29846 Transcript_17663/m.29846 type:complete len:212 (+) Transcript_17663:373-1008(+)
MKVLCGLLGDPQESFKKIHVAGTNGKGSVSIKTAVGLSKMLNYSTSPSPKVGLFISPHISTFRERCQIFCSGEEKATFIPKRSVIRHIRRIFRLIDQNMDKIHEAGGDVQAIRFFDIITIMAFLEFRDQACDYVVLECGVGGRLDATNVIRAPEVAAITSIGLDHTEMLGNTLPEIAFEKSKIIKPEMKGVVLGPTCQQQDEVFNQFKLQA